MPFDLVNQKGGTGSFDELRAAVNNANAIRRVLKIGVAASRPLDAPPKSVVGKDGGLTVPAGVFPIGLIDTKGVVMKPKTTDDPIDSLGEGTTRDDVTKVERDLNVTAQESYRRQVMELMLGQDLSKITPDKSTGELVIPEQSVPTGSQWWLWLFAYDINKATGNPIVAVKLLTNCTLNEAIGFTMADKGAYDADLSFKVLTDPTLQTHCINYIGGPGLVEMHAQLGWAAAPAQTGNGN